MALKQLTKIDEKTQAKLLKEAELISKLKFPGIITLYGVCVDPDFECLVMERCENSLDHEVYGKIDLPWPKRIGIAMSTVLGYFCTSC